MEKQHLLCDFPSAGLGDRGAHQITRGAFYLPKTREVLLHLREPPFARDKPLFSIAELSTTSWLRVTILDLGEERCQRNSRLRNACPEAFHFGLCVCDRRT